MPTRAPLANGNLPTAFRRLPHALLSTEAIRSANYRPGGPRRLAKPCVPRADEVSLQQTCETPANEPCRNPRRTQSPTRSESRQGRAHPCGAGIRQLQNPSRATACAKPLNQYKRPAQAVKTAAAPLHLVRRDENYKSSACGPTRRAAAWVPLLGFGFAGVRSHDAAHTLAKLSGGRESGACLVADCALDYCDGFCNS